MVISHKYRYVFIEIALTASWAIRQELCKHYDGVPILHKHATYYEFKEIATGDELNYFVFATVRNPLDKIVSRFLKIVSDHHGSYSNPEALENMVVDYSDMQRYRFIKETGADFESYFRKYFKKPYNDMVDLSADDLDFVIRFEHLQDDFSQVLEKLNIKQKQHLPVVNRTRGKMESFESYYTSAIIDQAKRVFGPNMKKWNYEFPSDWGDYQPSRIDEFEFELLIKLRQYYNVHLRYNQSLTAKFVKQLRARLLG